MVVVAGYLGCALVTGTAELFGVENSDQIRSRIRPRIPWVVHLFQSRQPSSDRAVPVPHKRSLVHSIMVLFCVLHSSASIKWGFCTNFSRIPGSQTFMATASHFGVSTFWMPQDSCLQSNDVLQPIIFV